MNELLQTPRRASPLLESWRLQITMTMELRLKYLTTQKVFIYLFTQWFIIISKYNGTLVLLNLKKNSQKTTSRGE